MPGKNMRLLLTLLAAVGIPYLWFSDRLPRSPDREGAAAVSGEIPAFRFSGATPQARPEESAADAGKQEGPTPAAETQVNELAEVLRFDVSPDWVTQRWPRVSSVRSEQNLEGMRVALVTGTDLEDVAGSLTYYFDMMDRVVRISFQGQTGSDRQLVELVTKTYGLHPEPSLARGSTSFAGMPSR